MSRSFANGNGETEAGNVTPLWLRRNWEYAEVRAWQYSFWTVQA